VLFWIGYGLWTAVEQRLAARRLKRLQQRLLRRMLR